MPDWELTSGLVQLLATAVFFACLPMLIALLVRLVAQRGPGPTDDAAWPDVCWAREAGGLLFVIGAIMLHLLLSYVSALVVRQWLDLKALGETDPVLAQVIGAAVLVGQWVLVCGAILLYIRLARRGDPVGAIGLGRRRAGAAAWTGLKMLASVMPVVIVLLVAAGYVEQLITHEPPAAHPVLAALEQTHEPWQIAALYVLAGLAIPLMEELFWRGIVMTSLVRSGSPTLAIVLSAMLFGLVHMPLYASVPALFALGLGLGYAYWRTRSLWAPVAMHAAFNIYNLTLMLGSSAVVDAMKDAPPS